MTSIISYTVWRQGVRNSCKWDWIAELHNIPYAYMFGSIIAFANVQIEKLINFSWYHWQSQMPNILNNNLWTLTENVARWDDITKVGDFKIWRWLYKHSQNVSWNMHYFVGYLLMITPAIIKLAGHLIKKQFFVKRIEFYEYLTLVAKTFEFPVYDIGL